MDCILVEVERSAGGGALEIGGLWCYGVFELQLGVVCSR